MAANLPFIGLFVAGSTGYGSSGGNLLTSRVTSAADGTFAITGDYTCPTPGSLVPDGFGWKPGDWVQQQRHHA
jgi:hypothetical protein